MSKEIQQQLLKHLLGGEAFVPLKKIIEDFPFEKINLRPSGLPYSFYEQFYHIVYAQKDILNFLTAENYKTPHWPKDYWPKENKLKNETSWHLLQQNYFEDRQALQDLLQENTDLLQLVKNGKDQTFYEKFYSL